MFNFRVFLVLCLNAEKTSLNVQDISVVGSSVLFVLLGWSMNWKNLNQSCAYCSSALSMASILFCYAMYYLVSTSRANYARLSPKLSSPDTALEYMIANVADRNLRCTYALAWMFPLFPTSYFLLYFGLISQQTNLFLIQILDFLAKIVFIIILTDGHIEALNPLTFTLIADRNAHNARRTFLRWVFHEVLFVS